HLLAAVVELEVLGREAADRLAVLDHLDGDLDDDHLRRPREGLLAEARRGPETQPGDGESGGDALRSAESVHPSAFQPSVKLHLLRHKTAMGKKQQNSINGLL